MKDTTYLLNEYLLATLQDQLWPARGNTTAYVLGQRIQLVVFDGNIYECIGAGTSAGAPPAFTTTLGGITTDGTVTWLTLKLGMPKRPMYVGLLTTLPSDPSGAGAVEVAGGSYARQAYQPTNANFTVPTAKGASSNKVAITFPGPSANWGTVVGIGIWDQLAAGNLLKYAAVTDPFQINNGDPAPVIPIGALQILDSFVRSPGLRTTTP